MNERSAFGPYIFALSEEERRVATARLALRFGLARRLERDYIAPLVLFGLLLVFVATLAFSGLIGRRSAEAALLIGAILFLASRVLAHWRLRQAQRLAKKRIDRLAARGETRMSVDESGLTFDADEPRCLFQDAAEAENAGGLIYLWRPTQQAAAIVIPTRIFADATEADRFLAFARARIGKR